MEKFLFDLRLLLFSNLTINYVEYCTYAMQCGQQPKSV